MRIMIQKKKKKKYAVRHLKFKKFRDNNLISLNQCGIGFGRSFINQLLTITHEVFTSY